MECKSFRVVALLLAGSFGCLGLDPSQPVGSYMQTNFTVEDGLPSNSVDAIVQTRNGFLWIGTHAGLARFNGRRFTLIHFRGPGAAPQGVIRALAEAENGDLWVGTGRGLFRIPSASLDDTEDVQATYYHLAGGTGDEIACLRFGPDGVLWVGTSRGLYRHRKGGFSLVLPNLSIIRLEETLGGHPLIISDQGFIEWDGMRKVDHRGLAASLSIHADQLFHVLEDHKGVDWFCTGNGLARRVGGAVKRFHPYGKGAPAAYRVVEDRQGNIWVFTQAGIFRAGANGLEPLAAGMNAGCAYSDRDGQLWIGRKGDGLVRFKDRPFTILRTLGAQKNTKPTAVLTGRDGKLWVGNSCGGLSLFNGRGFKTYNEKDGLSNSCVWALAEDTNDDLWLGTWGGGLFRFSKGKFTKYGKAQGLASDVVRAIAAAPDGSLWIATEDGLSHMLKGRFRNYSTADGLSSAHVVNVYRDRRGGIWAATSSGIDRMTGERFTPISASPKVVDSQYIGLNEDSSGNLYAFAAPLGAGLIRGSRLLGVDANLEALSMLEFQQHELWLSGNNGLFRLPADGLRRAQCDRQAPVDYARFGRADGLSAPAQSSLGVPNMTVTPDGKLWVATVQGLAVANLRTLPHTNSRAAIFVDEVTIGRVSQAAGRQLMLAPGTNHIEIQFDSIELASPEKIRFQYKLDGVDADWLNADKTRKAVYTSVPPGNHWFHIRACNRDGVWDRAGMTYNVFQRPYYYETNMFRIACLALSAALLSGVFLLRVRQITSQVKSRLEERLDERERIARDLHDTLLQSMQGLILRFQAITTQIPATEPSRRMMEECLDCADRVLIEGRDRVSTLRVPPEKSDLIQALARTGEEIERMAGLNFSIVVTGSPRDLHPVVREEAYWIGREALLNAFHHSKGRTVEMEIAYANRMLTLQVRDDGQGIDPKTLESAPGTKHWGVVGMRERAGKIGSHLAIHSRMGGGTEVELVIPASIAYRRRLRASRSNWFRQFRFGGYS